MVNDIFRCNKCNKVFISEEYEEHICTSIPKLSESKKIEMDYFITSKDENDRDVLLVKDINGVFYRFIDSKKQRIPYEYNLKTPNFKHPNGTPRDSTEPKIILEIYLLEIN